MNQLELPHTHVAVNGRLEPTIYTAEEAVRFLLAYIGEDPTRNGLVDTPARVVRALKEMTSGYKEKPEEILSKVFEESYDEVVIVRDIPFSSLCEHHMLAFSGTCDIGYVPAKDKGVVGLSKLARLVDCFSKRLQVQEKLTRQIAEAIQQHLEPVGAAVVIRATHGCMSCRGVKKSGVTMLTSVMLGCFRDQSSARSEFLSLCR